MKIGVDIDHERSLAAFTAAGHPFPKIPAGMNTVWHHFTTVDGLSAIIVNQTGFDRRASDDEEQVNGCSLAIAIDAPDEATARAALERWAEKILPPADRS